MSRSASRNGMPTWRGPWTSGAAGRWRRPRPSPWAGAGSVPWRGRPGWTSKSLRKLAAALREAGHRVSHQWVAEALRDLGYSLQGNRKTREGSMHPDRDAQFAHINAVAAAALAAGDPV